MYVFKLHIKGFSQNPNILSKEINDQEVKSALTLPSETNTREKNL